MIRTLVIDDEQPARERLQPVAGGARGRRSRRRSGRWRPGGREDCRAGARPGPARHPDARRQRTRCRGVARPAASGGDLLHCVRSVRGRRVRASAIDYLLKPVNRARLAAALDRVRPHAAAAGRDRAHRPDDAAQGHVADPIPRPARLRGFASCRQEVVAFTFVDGVTHLLTATEQLSMQPTLAALARRLDPSEFFQVSRTRSSGSTPCGKPSRSPTERRNHARQRSDDGRRAPPLARVARQAGSVGSILRI